MIMVSNVCVQSTYVMFLSIRIENRLKTNVINDGCRSHRVVLLLSLLLSFEAGFVGQLEKIIWSAF